MAIRPEDRYPTRTTAASSDYPHGSFRNKSSPSADDGTPLEQDWANDIVALLQGVIEAAGILPSGNVDTVSQSDYLDGLVRVASGVKSVNVGGGTDVTLGVDQHRLNAIRLTGTLTANIAVIVPDMERLYGVIDETSGGYTVTFRTAAGTGVSLPKAEFILARCDGTNVVPALETGAEQSNEVALLSSSNLAPHENLVVQPNAASPADQVEITADKVALADVNNKTHLASSVSITVDITLSGANGLDTGAESNNTWFHIWLIYNPGSDTLAGLISLSDTFSGLALPSGYTFAGYVGAVRNDGSGDFINFSQKNNFVSSILKTPLSNGSNTTLTSIDISASVPTTTRATAGSVDIQNGGGAEVHIRVLVSPNSDELGFLDIATSLPASGVASFPYRLPLDEQNNIYYRVIGADSRMNLDLTQWEY